MIYGELVQRWRLAQGAVLRKWPHKSGGFLHNHSRLVAMTMHRGSAKNEALYAEGLLLTDFQAKQEVMR